MEDFKKKDGEKMIGEEMTKVRKSSIKGDNNILWEMDIYT